MEFYLTRDENALYHECGYSCDNAILLRLGEERYFFTDGRYSLEAKGVIQNAEVIESSDLVKSARAMLKRLSPRRMIYNPLELSVGFFNDLSRGLKTRFTPIPHFHQKRRIIKTPYEVELIAQSQRLNVKAYERFARYLSEKGEGKTESRLHFEARRFLEKKGKYELSFNPIVGINGNAAKPHALPTSDRLKEGDLVLFDAGVKFERYCSDRTRTACVGEAMSFDKTQHFKDSTLQKIYDTVLKAQEHAIKHARVGMKAKEIDALARGVIEEAGYGSYFVHSTGHGIGLDIHELPVISKRSETVIEEGMVFSVEPGIYIPHHYGVRIEDLVVMREGKAQVL
ncbi:M24 family metallopeptidase [Wolinella succinogenes]|uniref:M24 family metallopeptidase n=1 Tax=Wolinella succinogenes TaxID=844 RepID=UPI00240A17D7|nr:M24 family metallopeptidase [Wolinella succinogenes]